MKGILVALILFLGTAVNAQMSPGQGQMGPGQGPQMPMMQMGMPMMQNMMAQQAMSQNMLQMMMEMSRIQERMLTETLGPSEKKKMVKELDQMQERISNMMVAPAMGAPKGTPPAGADPKLQCAKKQLEEAMKIQSEQLANPGKTSQASENEMMLKLKSAYECVQGPVPPGQPGTKAQPADHEAHH